MSFLSFVSALEQGFIFSLLTLGLFISFRILNTADLTSDGSFTLGAGISAVMAFSGHPFLGIILALAGGAFAGFFTSFLQTKLKIAPILSGIITMTALYSINLSVMGGRANINLLREKTFFDYLPHALVGLVIISIAFHLLISVFLKTSTGLALRAMGENAKLLSSLSCKPSNSITLGLMMANSLIALSGALLAQYQRFAEITMGTGIVVTGLASLIMGEVFLGCHRRKSMTRGIFACIAGSLVYKEAMALALSLSFSPQNLKLISALIVIVSISYPKVAGDIKERKERKAVYA